MTPSSVQYRITRVVGEGAFGTVYEAERVGEGLSRRVAMKLLHAAQASRPGIEARLRDEARMLSLIQHRAIVRVDDLIRVDDAWCVVMEYVAGADLGHLLERGPLPPRAALQVAEEVASALHAAYSQPGPEGRPLRLVHRDIKPENVRLTPQGDVKLLDFGIARAEFGAREVATRAGGMGTIIYMSAERFRGEDTHAGDVYALGVTLFELLVGVPPGASAADADRRPPGRTLRSEWERLAQLDPDLLGLLAAMMADEPEHRPTARECARTLALLRARVPGPLLEDWAEQALSPASVTGFAHLPSEPMKPERRRSASLPVRSNETMLVIGQTISPATEAPREAPTRRWLVVGAAAVALLVLASLLVGGAALLGWKAWSRTSAPVPVEAPQAMPEASAPSVAAPTPKEAALAPTPASVRPATAARSRSATPLPAPTPRALAPSEGKTRGTVVVTGAEGVVLDGPESAAAPGSLTPGTYTATVTFTGGTRVTVGAVRVHDGRTTRLACDERFATCSVSSPE